MTGEWQQTEREDSEQVMSLILKMLLTFLSIFPSPPGVLSNNYPPPLCRTLLQPPVCRRARMGGGRVRLGRHLIIIPPPPPQTAGRRSEDVLYSRSDISVGSSAGEEGLTGSNLPDTETRK